MNEPADHDKGHLGALFAGPPPQWAGRDRFVWLITGFGEGARFLAIWRAWRADPSRCERLHVIAIDESAVLGPAAGSADAADGLAEDDLAAQLAAVMPPRTPDFHRLSFDDGRVQLLLGYGAVADRLPSLLARVDRFDVDGRHVDGARPRVFKALARLASPQAVLVVHGAATALVDGGLRSAGFQVEPTDKVDAVDLASVVGAVSAGGGFDSVGTVDAFNPVAAVNHPGPVAGPTASLRTIVSRYAPAFTPRQAPPRLASPDAGRPRHALIVGAGLAGCAAAWALAEQGWTSTLVDRRQGIAQETSGQHAGLFHGIVTPQDGAHSRFNRTAALEVARWVEAHEATGSACGLLRLATDGDVGAMRRSIAGLGLPAGYVQALDATAASTMSGLALDHPAWFYPGGGWARPAALARSFFEASGAELLHAMVGSLQRHGERWRLLNSAGHVVAEAATVVWATGGDMSALVGDAPWPLDRVRGQTTLVPADTPGLVAPRLPIAGLGYALPAIDGRVMCGATVHDDDHEPRLREGDQRHNLDQLQRLTGSILDMDAVALEGRVGWRAVTPDKLPIIGAWPDLSAIGAKSRRPDQPAAVPRLAGLYVITGFASRGITWSALAAQTLASVVTGAPCPLPADLLDAVDAGRFVARAGRRSD